MNKISNEAKNVRAATWIYTNTQAKDKNSKKIDEERLNLVKIIEKSESKIKEIGDYNGNSLYKDSILKFLEIYKEVLVDDFNAIQKLEANRKNSFDNLDKIVLIKENSNKKLMDACQMLEDVELQFAKANDVDLVRTKSKVSERLKNANKVSNYYNSIFFLFFSAYYEEGLFLEALEKYDLEKMQEQIANLKASTKENLAKLNLKLDYKNDNSVLKTCEELLEFYQNEANSDFVKILDFQKFKANYTKTKETLEAKSSEERVKGEVAEYNKLVAEYNKKMESYNDLILNLNAKREALINKWNKVSTDFEAKHLNAK
jgi:hypothetical protein